METNYICLAKQYPCPATKDPNCKSQYEVKQKDTDILYGKRKQKICNPTNYTLKIK